MTKYLAVYSPNLVRRRFECYAKDSRQADRGAFREPQGETMQDVCEDNVELSPG